MSSDDERSEPLRNGDADVSHSGEKKRKTTYYLRKEEMAKLHEEATALQEQLQQSQRDPQIAVRSLVQAAATNAELQYHVQLGDLTIAGAQSLISSYGSQGHRPPIGGFIHLQTDTTERQQVLARMKAARMQEAVVYALTRSRFLDATKFTKQIDTFETDEGDFVMTHWEITPLDEADTVYDAYRELMYFTDTQEMSMSEKLGQLTIRESESDPVDGTQAVRMLATHENGIQSETNMALFSQYFENSEVLPQPHALLVTDFVDRDDLYPRQPETRIRKDVASLAMIAEAPTMRRNGRPGVTMVRWAHVRVYNSAFTNRRVLEQVAREGVSKWCDVMLKCVRERLAWQKN